MATAMVLPSFAAIAVAGRRTVDVTVSVVVPTDLRSASALDVSLSVRATMYCTRLRVQYWDAGAGLWRVLTDATQGLDEAGLDVDLGTATKVSAADGTLKLRLIAKPGAPVDLAVDRLAVTAQHRV